MVFSGGLFVIREILLPVTLPVLASEKTIPAVLVIIGMGLTFFTEWVFGLGELFESLLGGFMCLAEEEGHALGGLGAHESGHELIGTLGEAQDVQ